MTDTTSVRCDTCVTQKMAEVSGTGLRILSHAHGERHEVVLSPRATLERLAGTVDGSAIVNYVRGMVSC